MYNTTEDDKKKTVLTVALSQGSHFLIGIPKLLTDVIFRLSLCRYEKHLYLCPEVRNKLGFFGYNFICLKQNFISATCRKKTRGT